MTVTASETNLNYSAEQRRYIEFSSKCDTKLLATAGSGKTFCIIHHIRHLIDNHVYSPHHIFMLTFSRNAKDDFIMKMKKNKVDEVPIKNINTIDSFAWAIMGEDVARSIDVSILSYSLYRLLIEIKGVKQRRMTNPDLTIDDIMCICPIIHAFGIDFEDLWRKLMRIKCIFVDEAQDLNEVQYNILLHLKDVCGAELNLIGDPNQNIYQFRSSSDKFLVEYPARTFELTKNYRSKGHIVEFCSHLRPYQTSEITYEMTDGTEGGHSGDTGDAHSRNASHPRNDSRSAASSFPPPTPTKSVLEVTFYSYSNTSSFENYILSILHFFKAKMIPLHKVAILAPTRGYLRTVKGISKYKGLCYIANLLYKSDIPFQQFYNDMSHNNGSGRGDLDGSDSTSHDMITSDCDSVKVSYKMKRGHVNLMTYTASKGLEWDYVIVVDADAHLISRWEYDIHKFNAEKYLLYVACSRPRKNLIIFTKHRYTNPWFKDVPNDKYKLARICQDELEFFDSTKLFNGQNKAETHEADKMNIDETTLDPQCTTPPAPPTPPKQNVINLVNRLTEEELFDINSTLLPYIRKKSVSLSLSLSLSHSHGSHGPRAKDLDASAWQGEWRLKIPDNRQGFSSRFIEHLFYVHLFDTNLSNTPILRDIINVINSNNILYCTSNQIISWYFSNRDTMTWESYDAMHKAIHTKITQFVDSRFDRAIPFSSYTLVDKFYDAFIAQNYKTIKSTFNRYIQDPKRVENVLYISLVSYAVQSTHYFYILQFDKFYQEIIPKNAGLLEEIIGHASRLNVEDPNILESHRERIENEDLIAFVDYTKNGILHKLKPLGDDKLKDVISAIISIKMKYDILNKNDPNRVNESHMKINFNTVVLSKGVVNEWRMSLPFEIVEKIYQIVRIHKDIAP